MAFGDDPATEDEFEVIIQDALTKANDVQCSPATYREALQYFLSEIKIRIDASEQSERMEAKSDGDDE